jgi:ABC-2 type transport system ATP-binding protein
VGQTGPGFFDALAGIDNEPRAHRRTAVDRVRGSFHVRSPVAFASHAPGVTTVTATLDPQQKTTYREPTPVPGGGTPVRPVVNGPAAVPALLIEGVTKRFTVGRRKKPVVAITNVSLRLERGQIHGILGANGSGKSTLIRLVSGLLTLDEGRVEVFGHDIERDEMAVKRLINRVSVDAAFFKKLSPMENLLFAARLYGLDAGTARPQAISILQRLGVSEKRVNRPVEQMSRGMQQKVAIARALLTSPSLLLLDEPTTGLDPRSKLDVQRFIEEVRDRHDATIVLTTHDLAEAERLCNRITILNDGRVVAESTPDGLKRLVAERHGEQPTLEAAFMTYTGRSLDDDVEDDRSDDDE